MAVRTQFENSADIGVFSKLTNSYVPATWPLLCSCCDFAICPRQRSEANRAQADKASYCLTAVAASSNFYSVFEAELADVIPVIHTTIAGTRIIGRLTAGMFTICSVMREWRIR